MATNDHKPNRKNKTLDLISAPNYIEIRRAGLDRAIYLLEGWLKTDIHGVASDGYEDGFKEAIRLLKTSKHDGKF